jgi:hypothetical protein
MKRIYLADVELLDPAEQWTTVRIRAHTSGEAHDLMTKEFGPTPTHLGKSWQNLRRAGRGRPAKGIRTIE